MFIGTIWALTYKQHVHDVSRPIAMVAMLLLILSTAVSASCFRCLLSFFDFLQAHYREHRPCWRWTSEVSRHVPGWVSGVLRRPYPTNRYDQECVVHLTNSTCWRSNGGSILLYSMNPSGLIEVVRLKIYRCYVVWQSVLIIILPSVLWCSLVG
jgi:hypothetical protein